MKILAPFSSDSLGEMGILPSKVLLENSSLFVYTEVSMKKPSFRIKFSKAKFSVAKKLQNLETFYYFF